MNYQEYLDFAKSKGVILTQSLLYKYTAIGLTQEEETCFLNGGGLPENLDPQIVKDLALKWTREQVFERIPQNHSLAKC
jgi:hypothetical protein